MKLGLHHLTVAGIVGETFLATKTCHGVYLTGDELKAMLSKKKGAD